MNNNLAKRLAFNSLDDPFQYAFEAGEAKLIGEMDDFMDSVASLFAVLQRFPHKASN